MGKILKNRLLDIRLEMKYKYAKEFAEFLGISPNQYGRYENNRDQPTAEPLYKICNKTGRKIEDILYYTDEEP